MKIFLGFTAGALLALGAGAAQAQAIVYDTIASRDGITAGGDFVGDDFLPSVTQPNPFRITGFDAYVVTTGGGTFTGASLILNFYNRVDDSGVVSAAFQSPAGSFTVNLDPFTTAGAEERLISVNGLAIDLAPAPSGFGYGFTMQVNSGTGTGLTAGVALDASAPAGSSDGFYFDFNDDSVLQNDEYGSFNALNDNVAITLRTEAVPEPATLGAVAFGLAGLVTRRRKRG